MGGVAGADAKCQSLADNANLGGTYKAWISGTTDGPSKRFEQSGFLDSLPYYLASTRVRWMKSMFEWYSS